MSGRLRVRGWGGVDLEFDVAAAASSLDEVLAARGVSIATPCGGRGWCAGCRVRFVRAAPEPTAAERRILGERALRSGDRLACQTWVDGDAAIAVVPVRDAPALSKGFGPALLSIDGEAATGECLVADCGTTTVALARIDRATTRVLAAQGFVNPQVRFGADVLSRVDAASRLGNEPLRELLFGRLARACAELDPESSCAELLVCGNPAMSLLLLDADPSGLGRAPFEPPVVESQTLRILALGGRRLRTFPLCGGHVGGDAVAAAIACGLDRVRKPSALLDLGTNGEVLVSDGRRVLAASAAAGPAFGAAGSALVARTAIGLEDGSIDPSGRLLRPIDGLRSAEVRALQLAKGAVATALELLLARAGLRFEQLDALHLCGAFGARLAPEELRRIGLLPSALDGRVAVQGDAAAIGVRLAACSEPAWRRAVELAVRVEHVPLEAEPAFTETYARQLSFDPDPPSS